MLLYAFLQILTSSPLLPSEVHTTKMVAEIYRVLSPGSRFITFSLHPAHEVVYKYDKPNQYSWKVSVISFNNNFIRLLIIFTCLFFENQHFHVKSNRWNETNNRKRAVSHTMIICDKPLSSVYPRPIALLESRIQGLLTDEEDAVLKKKAEEVMGKVICHNFCILFTHIA